MPTRRMLPPAGCKMNDAGYPFRGVHRLEPPMNHGHSGVGTKGATALALRITGSNLSIERMQPARGQTLQCELGVDDGPPKPVSFPAGGVAVPVPGDGRAYHLTATVQSGTVRHVCRLTLGGSEGMSVCRLRAPSDARRAASIRLLVDGQRVRPDGGYFHIPIHARECALEVDGAAPLGPAAIVLQSVVGTGDAALLLCGATGDVVPLVPNRPVSVPADGGPFTLQLPRPMLHVPELETRPLPEWETSPVPELETRPVPELETRIVFPPDGDAAPPHFAAFAEGFAVELLGDDGASASGFGAAQLRLPDRREHRVRVALSDAAGRPVLRQWAVLPCTERPALALRVAEHPSDGRTVSGPRGARIAVDGAPPTAAESGVRVDGEAAHTVTVQEGAFSASLTFAPRAAVWPAAVPAVPAGGEAWAEELARALQNADVDAARRGVQSIVPPNPQAAAIVGFVADHLFRAPPTIAFTRTRDALADVHCAGYTLTAAVDDAAASLLSAGSGVRVAAGQRVALSAVSPTTGRALVTCRAHFAPLERTPDELLVARLLDTMQRHGAAPALAAGEIAGMGGPQSPAGAQLLLVLAESLRRAAEGACRPVVLRAGGTVGGGRLFLAIDAQPPGELAPGSAVEVRGGTNVLITPQLPGAERAGSGANALARALVEAYYKPSPPPLSGRWAAVPTHAAEERALVELLLQMLRDHEAALAAPRAAVTEAIHFACRADCLREVRTARACHLMVSLDGTGFAPLEQGGQVPQGYAFPQGSTHRVHLVARDLATGTPCGEAHVTLIAPETTLWTPAQPQAPPAQQPATFQYPTAAPTPIAAPIAGAPAPQDWGTMMTAPLFLDAAVSLVEEDIHLRLICPPQFRILCDLDAAGSGDAGLARSDLALRANAASPHNAHLRLLNASGGVVFEQKLVLPAVMASNWSVGLENSVLQVSDAARGTVVTASIDRAPERDFVSPLPFNSGESHTILLRKYFSGPTASRWNACAGELVLRVPAFIDPREVLEVARIYRTTRNDGEEMRRRFNDILARGGSAPVQELIAALIDSAISGRSTVSGGARVHFRISGDEASSCS